MIDAARFRTLVDERLDAVINAERSANGFGDPLVQSALDEIARLAFAGGKRTRPEFVHLGWVAAGGEPFDTTAVNIGAAFELLHVSALVHDDVIDGALLRRGRPTTHVHIHGLHVAQDWAGESRRVSEGAAVLIGNIALALADVALADVNPLAREEWTRVRLEVNAGQYLDLVGSAMRTTGADHARNVMILKTAKYTVERPLRMGAVATGTAKAGLVSALSAFGLDLGIAFQLRDDILGVFGSEETTGKPVGDDLREGKATLLLSCARERADGHQLSLLAVVGDPGLSGAQVGEIQQVIRDTGAVDVIEQEIVEHSARAFVHLAGAVTDGALLDQFRETAGRMTRRVS